VQCYSLLFSFKEIIYVRMEVCLDLLFFDISHEFRVFLSTS
jgi:hypothetical protein